MNPFASLRSPDSHPVSCSACRRLSRFALRSRSLIAKYADVTTAPRVPIAVSHSGSALSNMGCLFDLAPTVPSIAASSSAAPRPGPRVRPHRQRPRRSPRRRWASARVGCRRAAAARRVAPSKAALRMPSGIFREKAALNEICPLPRGESLTRGLKVLLQCRKFA